MNTKREGIIRNKKDEGEIIRVEQERQPRKMITSNETKNG